MKNLLTKTLFISLFLSAAIPSDIQASVLTNISARLAKIWNNSANFSKQIEKKTKEAWDNKWVRYGSYGVLTLTILYAALAHSGNFSRFSTVKCSLIYPWQKKSLQALRHTFEGTSFAKKIQGMAGKKLEIAKAYF